MKRVFFFFLLFPTFVSAGSLKNIEILNGTLSREFEPNNNVYSVDLEEGEEALKFNYELNDDGEMKIEETEYTTNIEITNKDGTKETYVFYLNKKNATPVFNELKDIETKEEKINNLEWYVGIPCILFILLLFRILVIRRKRKE